MKKITRTISIVLSAIILTSVVTTAPFSVSASETDISAFENQTGKNSDELPGNSIEQLAEKTSVKDNESETTTVSNYIENTTLSNNQQSKKNIEPVGASESFGDYEYTISNGTATITKYNGTESNVNIPVKFDDYIVSGIGSGAFRDNISIVSIDIPNSVTTIGQLAFASCTSLEKVTMNDNNANGFKVSIGESAFSGSNKLKDVRLSENVSYIDQYAFSNTAIESITIPKSVESCGEYGMRGPFYNCTTLTEIVFEEGTTNIPANICTCYNSISYLKKVVMPESVTSIGSGAFQWCDNLEIDKLPSNLISIGSGAFRGDLKIVSIDIPETVTTIGQLAFASCTSLKKIIIPNSVTTIGQLAFASCTSLEKVTMNDNNANGFKVSIGESAFSGSNKLKDVRLSENVSYIDQYAFSNTAIESITIPKSVESCGEYGMRGPFYNCTTLTEIVFEEGTTNIPANICTCYNSISYLKKVVMPESVTSIGSGAFQWCDNLEIDKLPSNLISIGSGAFRGDLKIVSIDIPETVTTIGQLAFASCTSLKKIIIPNSVTTINSDSFSNDNSLTIYGYENSFAEEYALNNGIPFVAIADEDTFIQKHLDFIGAENSNNTYHNQLQHFDLAEIALEDYGDLTDTYNLWRAVRGEIFDNPYYTVLSDMILSESAAQGQIESFDIHLDSEWRTVANDIIELINSKIDLTPSQESKIKKMFKKGDFTDETTFKFCQDILGNKVSKDELNSIFNAYDKTNTFLDVFNQGADIVESVYNTMNYSAILKAYEKTSDEFKVVLMQMAYTCQNENSWLYTAIEKYLKSDYDTEMRDKIVEEVAKNGLSIGKTLFKSSIENKVKAFIINNMDLSKVGTSVATKVLAFVEGCKIGYAIGTGIDNLLFSTDDVSNSFVAASATAKTAGYLKYVLETNESNLRNNPTIKNAVLFCETYNMYKNIQLNTADTMIQYFSKNQTSLINRIFQSNNVLYEHQIYNWQILKLNWQNASCHKGYILNSKLKNITVACPVDVTVYTSSGEVALQITDSVVEKNNGDVIATVCNNIKYITLPDDSYSIKITATENGTMTYSITDYNSFDNSSKTICFNNIPIAKDNEFTGNIVSGSEYSQNDISLYSNNETVESEVSEFTNESIIEVESINLSSNTLSLKTGETKTLSAIVEPSNASVKTVSWYSDDSKIVQVDEYGNVSGISAGTTKIFCVSLEGKVVAECEITVESKYDIGDTNLDGSITISDVTEIQKHLAELIHFSDEQQILADTNGDGIINITDATHLQKYLAEFDGVVLGKQSA